jgi:putative peptidoglycan lipid II flippase
VLSSLQYSLRLQELMLGIFAVAIGTVILPDLSAFAARKSWSDFNRLLAQAINMIALIMIPVTFYALVSGKNIIILLFKNRQFSDESVALTLAAFTWHIAGLYFIALNRVIAPAFYAQSDTKSPTIAGIGSFAANIVLALALVGPMKGGGIALALSLASLANTAFLFWFLAKSKTVDFARMFRSTGLYALKLVAFSILAAVPIWYFHDAIYAPFARYGRLIGQGVPLTISLFAFAAVGFALLVATRDKLTLAFMGKLKGKLVR